MSADGTRCPTVPTRGRRIPSCMRPLPHRTPDRPVRPAVHGPGVRRRIARTPGILVGAVILVCTLASCSTAPTTRGASSPQQGGAGGTTTTAAATTTTTTAPPGPRPLPAPAPLTPFAPPATPTDGTWAPAGRTVDGFPAVYETHLIPPGGSAEAGIAWMDTSLLSAQLYSGSK